MSNKYFFQSGLANLYLVCLQACVFTNAAFSKFSDPCRSSKGLGKKPWTVWTVVKRKLGNLGTSGLQPVNQCLAIHSCVGKLPIQCNNQ